MTPDECRHPIRRSSPLTRLLMWTSSIVDYAICLVAGHQKPAGFKHCIFCGRG